MAASVAGFVAGCGSPAAYTCMTSAECVSHGADGTCEAQGYCSFPDSTCSSGRRFEPNAGGGLGGTCATGALLDAPLADAPRDASPDAALGPIAFVQLQATSVTTALTQTLAFDSPVTAHSTLVICTFSNSPGDVTITDSIGSTFVPVVGPVTNSGARLYTFAAFDVADDADTVTATVSSPPTSFELYIHEYAGLVAFDVGAAGTGTSAATDGMASGIAHTHFANELIFGFGITGAAATGTSFTTRSVYHSNITEDQIVSGSGDYQANATMVSGSGWTMLMAAFRGT